MKKLVECVNAVLDFLIPDLVLKKERPWNELGEPPSLKEVALVALIIGVIFSSLGYLMLRFGEDDVTWEESIVHVIKRKFFTSHPLRKSAYRVPDNIKKLDGLKDTEVPWEQLR